MSDDSDSSDSENMGTLENLNASNQQAAVTTQQAQVSVSQYLGLAEWNSDSDQFYNFCTSQTFVDLTPATKDLIFDSLNVPGDQRAVESQVKAASTYYDICKRAFFQTVMDPLGSRNIFEYQAFNPADWRRRWLSVEGFAADVAYLVLIGLTTGNKISLTRRSAEGVNKLTSLNAKYSILTHNSDTKNDATAFTLTRCVQSFPIICVKAFKAHIVKPKLMMMGFPVWLSFPGSGSLVPDELWPEVCECFYGWNAVFGMLISQGKNLSKRETVKKFHDAISGVPISEADYQKNINYINLSRSLDSVQRVAYNRFFSITATTSEIISMKNRHNSLLSDRKFVIQH